VRGVRFSNRTIALYFDITVQVLRRLMLLLGLESISIEVWALIFAIVGIAAAFIAASLVGRRYYRKQAKDARQALEGELKQAASRVRGDIRNEATYLKRVELKELEDVAARVSDKGFPEIAENLQSLKTSIGLYNENLLLFGNEVDRILMRFRKDCLDRALEKKIDARLGEDRTVRVWLNDYSLYEHWFQAQGGWLKAVCIVFKECGTFTEIGKPPGHAEARGSTFLQIDDEWFVVSEEVEEEAGRIFATLKMKLEMVYPFRDKLLERL